MLQHPSTKDHMTRARVLLMAFGLAVLFLATASAADVAGKWKAEFNTPDGQTRVTTFVFKVDGDKLTGAVASQQAGDAPIADGKVAGDEVSFTVVRNFGGNEVKLSCKGKVAGNEIQFTLFLGLAFFAFAPPAALCSTIEAALGA